MKKAGLKIKLGIVLLMFSMCQSGKVVYVFPERMTEEQKKTNLEQCEQGRVLFDINCASCHVKKEGRKRIIPDFTAEQLTNYEIRFLNKSHTDSLTESQMSQDELSDIITFLIYKKPNEIKEK